MSKTAAANDPLHMAFLFMPNGVRPDYWTPAGNGDDYEITPRLKHLKAFRGAFLLLEHLWHKNTLGRNGHWPKVPAWLSGGYVQRSNSRDLDSGGTSVDQLAGERIGDRNASGRFPCISAPSSPGAIPTRQ